MSWKICCVILMGSDEFVGVWVINCINCCIMWIEFEYEIGFVVKYVWFMEVVYNDEWWDSYVCWFESGCFWKLKGCWDV